MENVSLHLTQEEVDYLLAVLKNSLRTNEDDDNKLYHIVNNIESQISM